MLSTVYCENQLSNAFPDSRSLGLFAFPLEDSLVLISAAADRLFVLNSTSRLIWDAHGQGWSLPRIAAMLAQQFGVPIAATRRDVDDTLAAWRTQGLLDGRNHALASNALASAPDEPAPLLQGAGLTAWRPHSERYYRLFDLPFCLRYGGPELETWIHPLVAHLETASATEAVVVLDALAEEGEYILRRDGVEVERGLDRDEVIAAVHRAVSLLNYSRVDYLAVLHAAAVSDGERCAAVIGPGGSGKTTLAAALVSAGCRYLSEDIVPLERGSLCLTPVPVSLVIKEGSWRALAPYYPALAELPVCQRRNRPVRYLPPPGGLASLADRKHRVSCLLSLQYAAGAGAVWRRLSAVETLQRLMESQIFLGESPDPGKIGELIQWIAATPGYELRYGTLAEAVPMVRELLAQ